MIDKIENNWIEDNIFRLEIKNDRFNAQSTKDKMISLVFIQRI
jgi:hypothetical protein